MSAQEVEARLEQWLKLAHELAEGLEQAEADPALVEGILARRRAVQQELARLVDDQAPANLKSQGRVAELVSAILVADRRSARRAAQLREAAAQKLEELRTRREMAAGYRRAITGAVHDGPAFYDRRV